MSFQNKLCSQHCIYTSSDVACKIELIFSLKKAICYCLACMEIPALLSKFELKYCKSQTYGWKGVTLAYLVLQAKLTWLVDYILLNYQRSLQQCHTFMMELATFIIYIVCISWWIITGLVWTSITIIAKVNSIRTISFSRHCSIFTSCWCYWCYYSFVASTYTNHIYMQSCTSVLRLTSFGYNGACMGVACATFSILAITMQLCTGMFLFFYTSSAIFI